MKVYPLLYLNLLFEFYYPFDVRVSILQQIHVLNWADQPMETSPALENKSPTSHAVMPVILATTYRDLMVGIREYT